MIGSSADVSDVNLKGFGVLGMIASEPVSAIGCPELLAEDFHLKGGWILRASSADVRFVSGTGLAHPHVTDKRDVNAIAQQ